MKILSFDTSTKYTALALVEGENVLADVVVKVDTKHSQQLLALIDQTLRAVGWDMSVLDGLVVGVGPGLFTGLRVGVATAQGLVFAQKCPLVGVCSLEAHAMSAGFGPALVAVCKDARKKEIYTGLYRRSYDLSGDVPVPILETVKGPRLLSPDAFVQELLALDEEVLLLGDGVDVYRASFAVEGARFVQDRVASHSLHAVHLARVGSTLLQQETLPALWEVLPIYIRPSEAEMNIGPPEGGAPLAGRLNPDGSIIPESEA